MECEVLTVANSIVDNTIRMIKLLMEHKVVITIENPRSSTLWHFPNLQELVQAVLVWIMEGWICNTWGLQKSIS